MRDTELNVEKLKAKYFVHMSLLIFHFITFMAVSCIESKFL